MAKLLKSPVATMTITACGKCPFHSTKYKRVHTGKGVFASQIDHHECDKSHRRVDFTTIPTNCPLPNAPEGVINGKTN